MYLIKRTEGGWAYAGLLPVRPVLLNQIWLYYGFINAIFRLLSWHFGHLDIWAFSQATQSRGFWPRAVVALVGRWLTKIHLFSFIVSHFPQDSGSCNYRTALENWKHNGKEHKKYTQNQMGKNLSAMRRTEKSFAFFVSFLIHVDELKRGILVFEAMSVTIH